MTTVFIDGSSGTTGLQIHERLSQRSELTLLQVPYELRHEEAVRKEALNAAEVVFLCLPDDAADVSASLVENDHTVVIDTSTGHRTAPGWVYGLPELDGQKERIAAAKRIANPGCHASGFIALSAPLVKAGVLSPEAKLHCTSLTGYSGGGKKMIAQYEQAERDPYLDAPRMYGLAQTHKHLREMQVISGLVHEPGFCPVVADFYSGMETIITLFEDEVCGGIEAIKEVYRSVYHTGLIRYETNTDESGFLSAAAFAGRDDMQVSVDGNEKRILLTARFDNLGKGACGAAIQNMNLVLGLPEDTGLRIGEKG